MSLFRRPKKANIQRRVFSAIDDDEEDPSKQFDPEAGNAKSSKNGKDSEKMDVDDSVITPPPPTISHHKYEKKSKDTNNDKKSNKKSSLLSFGDEEEDGEVFQVKKSSHSKKVMKMLDKERRRKKQRDDTNENSSERSRSNSYGKSSNGFDSKTKSSHDVVQATSYDTTSNMDAGNDDNLANNKKRQKSSQISNSSIHTEIRTDDFVICAPVDGVAKSHIIVNTLPRVWLQQKSIAESLDLFIQFVISLQSQIDRKNPLQSDAVEKLTQMFNTFHLPLPPTV